MKPNLEDVSKRLAQADELIPELLKDTEDVIRIERALSAVKLMISCSVHEVKHGGRAKRSADTILGQVQGFNGAAIRQLEGLKHLDIAQPYAPRLQKLIGLLQAVDQ